MGALVALAVMVGGCGRYSYVIRRQYEHGRYGATVARCENDAWVASQQWNSGHRARYHVYCGMAYLSLGDSQRAATELVQAEKMRLENPRLITGRDLAKLSQGLVRLFGVPAGQLEIEERPTQVAQGPEPVAPPVTVVPPEPAAPPAPPVVSGPSVSFSASAGVSGRASVQVVPAAPEPPAAPAPPPAAIEISAEPPAATPPPPVIVIPAEDGALIE
jgi:hypothetical protein